MTLGENRMILLVEDDQILRRDMREILSQNGYRVHCADNYRETEQILWESSMLPEVRAGLPEQVDLFLIDVMLPDGSGFSLCERIRQEWDTPIIFLTACSDEESVVRGLNMGGDDYVTKPFRVAELLSRISANLRRSSGGKKILQSGDLKLCRDSQILLRREGETWNKVGLSKVEWMLLEYLMLHRGKVLRREQILAHIWDEQGNYVEDNTLSVTMSRLKKKIGAFGGQPYWEVVWGVGYRYVADVRESTSA